MPKHWTACVLVLTVGTLATTPVAMAQDLPTPTVVRKAVEPCTDSTPIGESCACQGGFCFARSDVDRINTIIKSEAACRVDLAACREATPPPPVEPGWDPDIVLAVGVAVVLVIAAGGVAAGYGLAKLTD